MFKCLNVHCLNEVFKCSSVEMFKCLNVQVFDVQVFKCSSWNVQVFKTTWNVQCWNVQLETSMKCSSV